MSITNLTSISDLDRTVESAKGKLVVIDFHATWCGPCHAIAPRYEAFSKKYTNVVFTKCDVDAAQPVAAKFSVSAMPTFIFLKSGSKVDQVRGADPNGVERAIQAHMGPGGSGAAAFTGKGQTLAGQSVQEAPGAFQQMNLGAALGPDPQAKIFVLLIGLYVGYLLFF